MFDACLFDLDGTLIDTESLAISSNLEVFAALGHPVSLDFLHQLIGKDSVAAGALIAKAYPTLDIEELDRALYQSFYSRIGAGLPLKPGASELLAQITMPKAIVTSTGREGAHRKLEVAGIAGFFADVITRDDVTRAKPDPEPYLLAARRLGVTPARCLVFEDSDIGAEAAHRAGCVVVQVPDMLQPAADWADHVAPDLLTGARLAGLSRA